MNRSRRQVLAIGAQTLITLGLSGCTEYLYKQPEKRIASRTESLNAILLSADEKYLVALCPDFHYVFETSPSLVAFLRSNLHPKGKASFSSIFIKDDGKTIIHYKIQIPDSLDKDEERLVSAMGFKKRDTWILEENLDGTCYRADGKKFDKLAMIRLNNTYEIKVSYETSNVPLAAKIALTPVTLAADGVILVLAVPFTVITLVPFLLLLKMGS